MKIRGNQKTTRALNRRFVLNQLRQHGGTSRSKLATISGLSPAAITFVINELIEEDLVKEGKALEGTGGRRPVTVDIDYASRHVIGFKLMEKGLEAVLTDLSTATVHHMFGPIDNTEPDTVVQQAAKLANQLVVESGINPDSLIGVGLAMPCNYHVDRGLCNVDRFGWTDIPIGEMLSGELKLPVWVDNDVNSFALAQYLFGLGQQNDNLMALAIGAGIAISFMTDGLLHRGANGSAGEIGHTIVKRDGRLCECGRRGCAQAYWSEASLNADWATHSLSNPDVPSDLGLALQAENGAAIKLVREAGAGIGELLAGVINTIDPDIIVVGGEGVRFGDYLRLEILNKVRELSHKSQPDVIFEWHHDSWPRGAAALAVERFFNFELHERDHPQFISTP